VVKLGVLFCATHAKQNALTDPSDPLAELASEFGDLCEIHEVSQFLSKILKLACQNRISLRRATALTFIANSLLTSFRLLNAEDRIAAKDPENLRIDWTCVPRPDRDRHSSALNSRSRTSWTPLTLLSLYRFRSRMQPSAA
jgi:hypothetical protein